LCAEALCAEVFVPKVLYSGALFAKVFLSTASRAAGLWEERIASAFCGGP
jgi:hypothetical protein